MEREEILKALEGKEMSAVSLPGFCNNDGVYVGPSTIYEGAMGSPDSSVFLHRDYLDRLVVDTVPLWRKGLKVYEFNGELNVDYETFVTSAELTEDHENYKVLHKLAEQHGL